MVEGQVKCTSKKDVGHFPTQRRHFDEHPFLAFYSLFCTYITIFGFQLALFHDIQWNSKTYTGFWDSHLLIAYFCRTPGGGASTAMLGQALH